MRLDKIIIITYNIVENKKMKIFGGDIYGEKR